MKKALLTLPVFISLFAAGCSQQALVSTPTLTATQTATLHPTKTPTITNTPTLEPGATMAREKDGMVMVYVPAEEFTMGINADAALAVCQKYRGPEAVNLPACALSWFTNVPPHPVYLDSFWIDQTEVTNAMYASCVNVLMCDPPSSSDYTIEELGNLPVSNVNWYHAKAYCDWAGADLPTEAQWEKAARGTDGRIYPWGDDVDCSKANFFTCNQGKSTAVGSHPAGASPYGALDMAGNVEEWVNDWFTSNYYNQSPSSNPTGPESGERRVIRDGSYGSDEIGLFTTWRASLEPVSSGEIMGFRCAYSGESTSLVVSTPLPTVASMEAETIVRVEDYMVMVSVPAGEFMMGSNADDAAKECQKFFTDCSYRDFRNEVPSHLVYLDAYWIDQTEVSNTQYKICVDFGPCSAPSNAYYAETQMSDSPITDVNWDQAKAYCTWVGADLPTEAQWEKAARGTDGRTYPWGNELDCTKANYRGCENTYIDKNSTGASPYGALNMADGVREWVNDWSGENYYYQSPSSNPTGPELGESRVIRGGSDWELGYWFRTAYRSAFIPVGGEDGSLGFRCARDVAP